jgi:hypothetical protein
MGKGYPKKGWTMIEVDLLDYDVQTILAIVAVLKSMGYVTDKDFTFQYYPAKWDNFFNTAVNNRHTIFKFSDGSVASWFTLKYKQ